MSHRFQKHFFIDFQISSLIAEEQSTYFSLANSLAHHSKKQSSLQSRLPLIKNGLASLMITSSETNERPRVNLSYP